MYALVGYAIVNDELEPPDSGRKYRPPIPDGGYTTPPRLKTSPLNSSEPRKKRRKNEWERPYKDWSIQEQDRLRGSPKNKKEKNPAKGSRDDGVKYFLHQRNSPLLF